MAIDSKRKGKAGGARVITYTTLVDENTGEVWLIGYVFIDTLRRNSCTLSWSIEAWRRPLSQKSCWQ